MVSVLVSSAVDRGFEPWLDQTKDYKIYSGYINKYQDICNRIGGVMVSMLVSSGVDCGFEPKTMKLLFVASPLSTQH
jgi:hypothetical protein